MASPSNLIARIYSLYQDRVNSGDFELQVPRPNCSTFDRIPVHKTILATGSPFLKYIVASKSYVQLNSFSFNEIHQITSQEGRINTATVQRMVEVCPHCKRIDFFYIFVCLSLVFVHGQSAIVRKSEFREWQQSQGYTGTGNFEEVCQPFSSPVLGTVL